MMQARGAVARIYANMGLLVSGKAAAGLLSLIYLAIAARSLGTQGYGLLVLIHGYVIAVAAIITFPGWPAVVRYGAQAMGMGDICRLQRLLRFTCWLELIAGAVAIAFCAALLPWVAPHLDIPPDIQRLMIPYSLAILGTMRTTPYGLLQLQRRFRLLGIHTVVNPAVRMVGTLLVVACGWGLQGFLAVWLAASLAECASMWMMGWWALRHAHPAIGPISGGSVRDENPGIVRFMILANADATFVELVPRLSLLIVGWILGPVGAGLYSVAQRATVIIAQPAILLGQAAYGELTHLIAAQGQGRALRYALLLCIGIAMLAASPVMLLLALFPEPMIDVLAGPAFAAASGVLLWLMASRVILMATPPLSAALTAMGAPGLSVAANSIASLALLPLLPLFLHSAGLIGAGWFAVLEAATASLLLVLFVLRRSGSPTPCPA